MTNFEKVINGIDAHMLAVLLIESCPFPHTDCVGCEFSNENYWEGFCNFPCSIESIEKWLRQEVEE